MSAPIVVDSSVVLKWLIREEHSENSLALRADATRDRRTIIVPPLLASEITNALYQRERRGLMSASEADNSFNDYAAQPLRVVAPERLYASALELARRHTLAATYDAQYLALALSEGVDLWTADLKLVRSLPRSMKWVRWIGDYTSES